MNSAINGNGYGSKHTWRAGETGWTRTTPYVCIVCGVRFGHHYPSIENIFTAMRMAGVPEECVPPAVKLSNEPAIQEAK